MKYKNTKKVTYRHTVEVPEIVAKDKELIKSTVMALISNLSTEELLESTGDMKVLNIEH